MVDCPQIHKFLTDIGYHPIFRYLISLACFSACFLGLSDTVPPPLLSILLALCGITTWDVPLRVMIFCHKCDMAMDIAAIFHTDTYFMPGQNDSQRAELNTKLLPAWH
ncbi:hypothetical protein B0H14DRAFT_3524270 [Mycena olivaceomarginata]|nr:hypothetical protein B0H14DRAFT_3524270 [Mycena olivaceomarginata]